MEKEDTLLLNRLDAPLRFLGIHKDEAFSLLCPCIAGLYTGWTLSGFLFGFSALLTLRALKKRNEGASLIHALYWYFPTFKKTLKLYVPSHVREYVG